jgi:vitamin B12 transporter
MKIRSHQMRLAALSFLAVLNLPAQGQSSTPLGETVVTATRVEQAVTDVVADVSIIGREDIERLGVSSVPQLLARLPGLQVVVNGDVGRVYIRGADSRMTALYVDGVRVDSQDGTSLLGGGVPWSLIPVSQIERIEVLRGSASAVYGSDAMGGVVQIFTRRGQGGFTPYADAGFGNLGTRKAGGGFSGAHQGWDYAVGLGHESTDGYNTRPDVVHTPEREDGRLQTASVRLGHQLVRDHRLEYTGLASETDSRYVPWGGGTDYQAHGSLSTAALKWEARWSERYSTGLSLSRSVIAKRDDMPNDYRTKLQGVLFENRLKLAGGTLSAVLEERRDDFEAQPSAWDPAFRGDRSQRALALGYGLVAGPHSLQMNARHDRDSLFGGHLTGAIAYGYVFAPGWRATGSAGTAFRAPTLEQLFGPYGSTALAPETSQSQELGVSYAAPTQDFKAVVYRNEITDMISSSQTLTTCSAGWFCYYNVGRALIEGVTLSGQQRLQRYTLRASLDLLDPRDAITGNDLSLRARRVATAGIDRELGPGHVGLDVQAVGERYDNAANTVRLPGYVLLALHAHRRLAPDWRLVARLDNATDASYQQIANFATPGRTVFVGVQWRPQP